jgi:hypothetical protein
MQAALVIAAEYPARGMQLTPLLRANHGANPRRIANSMSPSLALMFRQ